MSRSDQGFTDLGYLECVRVPLFADSVMVANAV